MLKKKINKLNNNKPKIMKSKKIFITLIVLIVWAVFSVGYIGYMQWQQFKNNKLQQAYQSGISYVVDQLITQTAKCQVVPINLGDKKANLVDTSCLQQNKEADKQASPATTDTTAK